MKFNDLNFKRGNNYLDINFLRYSSNLNFFESKIFSNYSFSYKYYDTKNPFVNFYNNEEKINSNYLKEEDDDEFKYYTYKNTVLRNSRICLNYKKSTKSKIMIENSNDLILNSKFLKQGNNNKNKYFEKCNKAKYVKKYDNLSLKIQNVETISIQPTVYSANALINYDIQNKMQLNKNNYFQFTDEENIIDNLLKLRKIFKEEKNVFNKKEIRFQNSHLKYFTDKNKKTISKIYEKEFDPNDLFRKYKISQLQSDKKDKSLLNLLNEFKKKHDDEEIDFLISDSSLDCNTNEENNETPKNNAKKYLKDKKNNEILKKSLIFSDEIKTTKETGDNTNCFNVQISTIQMLNNETDSEMKIPHIKNNSEFELISFNNSINNSQSSTSKKKVTFLDDTAIYEYDRTKGINYVISKTKISNLKKKKNKNNIKSILIKKDNSSFTTDIELSIGRTRDSISEFDKVKSVTLEKLNKLIQECEVEEKKENLKYNIKNKERKMNNYNSCSNINPVVIKQVLQAKNNIKTENNKSIVFIPKIKICKKLENKAINFNTEPPPKQFLSSLSLDIIKSGK